MAPDQDVQAALDQAHVTAQLRRFGGPSDADILRQLQENAARLIDIGVRLHDTCERIAALREPRA